MNFLNGNHSSAYKQKHILCISYFLFSSSVILRFFETTRHFLEFAECLKYKNTDSHNLQRGNDILAAMLVVHGLTSKEGEMEREREREREGDRE